MKPRISIITPSYQQAEFLPQCLDSVHGQAYPALEHIVVDGGSTDGSKAVIEAAANKLAWWCSEKDEGQSHAINKGLAQATGEVFGWLNSDDLLLPGSLNSVGDAFAADPDLLVFAGRRVMRSATGVEEISRGNDPTDPRALFVAPSIDQQSTFYRLEAVRAIGGVEQRLHHVMDLELWWQILFAHGTVHLRATDQVLAVFRLHEASKTGAGTEAFRRETASVLAHMALRIGLEKEAEILRTGYPDGPQVRNMPVTEEQRRLVQEMITFFLLKWHAAIHSRSAFHMMREFRKSVTCSNELPGLDVAPRLAQLDEQLRAPNWLAFRARRKFGKDTA